MSFGQASPSCSPIIGSAINVAILREQQRACRTYIFRDLMNCRESRTLCRLLGGFLPCLLPGDSVSELACEILGGLVAEQFRILSLSRIAT